MINEDRISEIVALWHSAYGCTPATRECAEAIDELLSERKQLVAIVEVVEKMFSSKAGLNDLDLLNEALKAWRGDA